MIVGCKLINTNVHSSQLFFRLITQYLTLAIEEFHIYALHFLEYVVTTCTDTTLCLDLDLENCKFDFVPMK